MKTLYPVLGFAMFLIAAVPAPEDARYTNLRKAMVASQIAVRGVTDPATLRAVGAVRRHLFVPEDSRGDAYDDRPLRIGYGQTISQPFIVAYMTQTIPTEKTAERPGIESVEEPRLALEHVTLKTPDSLQTLIRDLSIEAPAGKGLLITGVSGVGKSSLLRAVAGLWDAGVGRIARPPLEEMLFLPQRPYMVIGSLREQLLYPKADREVGDAELRAILERVNLADLPERVGGFDAELDWGQLFSLGEQQRLAFARLILARPGYAILDEATSALDGANEALLYRELQNAGTTYISVGHRPSLLAYHDRVLELQGGGNWRLKAA